MQHAEREGEAEMKASHSERVQSSTTSEKVEGRTNNGRMISPMSFPLSLDLDSRHRDERTIDTKREYDTHM